MNAANLSRAADASWRHFAPVSTSNASYPATRSDGRAFKIKGKDWTVPGEDYVESHPVAEAARILFYQAPASARWVFDFWRATR